MDEGLEHFVTGLETIRENIEHRILPGIRQRMYEHIFLGEEMHVETYLDLLLDYTMIGLGEVEYFTLLGHVGTYDEELSGEYGEAYLNLHGGLL